MLQIYKGNHLNQVRIFMSHNYKGCDSLLNHFAIYLQVQLSLKNLNSRTMTYWAIDKISLLEPHAKRVHRDYDEEHHVHTYHHHDNEEQQPVLERLQMHIVCGQSVILIYRMNICLTCICCLLSSLV